MSQANKQQTVTVVFKMHEEINHPESQSAGRPIYDDIEVCEIRFPGDTKTWAVFPALEAEPNATRERGFVVTYAEVFNEQYLQFKSRQQQTVSGTPLSEAPFLSEGKRRELRALNIHSVEQLAALDGANLKTLGMGGREWKNQAAAFLAAANGTANVTAMAATIAQLQETVKLLLAGQGGAASQIPSAPPPGGAGDGAALEIELNDCSDDQLREFIKKESGKAAPHNAGRPALLARATEIALKDDKAA